MTDPALDFATASRLDPIGEGRFRARVDPSWGQGRSLFGGIQAALLVRAMEPLVAADGRRLRTLQVTFCRAATPGDLTVSAALDREGRSVTHAHARLHIVGGEGDAGDPGSGDDLVATALATYASDRDDPRAWNETTRPELPPPGSLRRLDHPLAPAFTRHFDVRFVPGQGPFAGGDEPQVAGWLRFAQPIALDPAAAVALLDVWPPAVLATLAEPRPSSSVDLRYDFLAAPPWDDVAQDELLAFHCRVSHWRHGHGIDEGELWTRDGRPLALVRQLRAVF